MRKFENVDIVAALGAVVELNTENYKGDFKYDIAQFKAAALNPDGENNRLLWYSRRSGTHCFPERDVYIKDTAANNTWGHYVTLLGKPDIYQTAVVQDRIIAFAVDIKGIGNGKIKGDLHELNYGEHVKQVTRAALPRHTVTVKYADGTKMTLPHAEHDGQRDRLYREHGDVKAYHNDPEDKNALRDVLAQARDKREKESRPAVFKVRVKNQKPVTPTTTKPKAPTKSEQPSIKQQLAEGKKQISEKKPAPTRAAVKNKSTGLGD